LASQHTDEILDKSGERITQKARNEMIEKIARPVVGKLADTKTEYYVNQTGKFVVGGPQSDTGVTGRKIIVDTYGGVGAHGGGAFSGKDPSKVDRSASYFARYVAKNIVAAKLASRCEIQVAYAIGVAEPVSIMVNTFGTGEVSDEQIVSGLKKAFDFTPLGIIKQLNLVNSLGIPISVNNIIGFPTETRELAFDTIELNRHFKSDGVNAYSYTPFHGTPLRQLSEDMGYVKKGDLARCISQPTMISMPQFTKEEIEGVRRCFVLYVKMPKKRWPEIRKAETLTPEGERIFRKLKDECLEKYMHYGDYAKEDDVEKVEFAK